MCCTTLLLDAMILLKLLHKDLKRITKRPTKETGTRLNCLLSKCKSVNIDILIYYQDQR